LEPVPGPSLGDVAITQRTESSALDTDATSSSAAAAPASPPSLRLGLAGRILTVKRGKFRVRVSCSATVRVELVVLVPAERIAHKRFTCRPPARTVRVRLDKAGRKLVAHDHRVSVTVQVLPVTSGQPAIRQMKLVSRRH
jgi:hypothetical protein